MNKIYRHFWKPAALLLAGLFLLPGLINTVNASSERYPSPPGFELIDSGPGVEFFRKDYSGGTPDFVQSIDLLRGAEVTLMHGDIVDPGTGLGAYGGENPLFSRQSLQDAWQSFAAGDKRAFCLINGIFFSTDEDPTPLALPLKVNDKVVSQGYGPNDFADKKVMLELWPDHARISPLSAEALSASSAPQILTGYNESADFYSGGLTGRTLIGIQDPNGDGKAERILIFSSKKSSLKDASNVLRSFGAEKIVVLDGGDSAQLICKDNPYVYSNRAIPQTVGVSTGTSQPYAMSVAKQTDWQVIVVGDSTEVSLTLRNDGTETWLPGEVELVNKRNDWGAGSRLQLPVSVAPGQTTTFSWMTDAFKRSGVFTSQWDIAYNGKNFANKPIVINVIVLPQELADKKNELENQVREWGRQQLENIEQLVLAWIQERVRQGFDKICPASSSLPIFVAAAGAWQFIRRKKRK
jgi:hypothetical protein